MLNRELLPEMLCLFIWLLRCRRVQLQRKEEQNVRRTDIDSLKERSISNSSSKRVISDTVTYPKQAEYDNNEMTSKTAISIDSTTSSELYTNRGDHLMLQTEMPRSQSYVLKQSDSMKPLSVSKGNSGHGSLSMSSIGVLQRNDSKVNVFRDDKVEEIDLNPGLNNIINLETL
ncbi:hypothetical protein DICVIV_07219 [Dictyocaulus viviparus]|uniref:Uncharacterized protein n=1 Tax=Dictyocaulus viviparus TaxID=29172 RepID=A0A0D8XQE0_DICVI|nr:hypothetical protein DICVIV_07219 [Dictyocaulus viviparus]